MSTQLASVTPTPDISTTPAGVVFTAAKHLVEHRDGLAGVLLFLARHTADMSCPDAAAVISMALAGLGADEAHRRGAQIAHLATPCWGFFRDVPDRRENALAVLRAVCHDTATAVRDALHRDSCVCHSADLTARITATKGVDR